MDKTSVKGNGLPTALGEESRGPASIAIEEERDSPGSKHRHEGTASYGPPPCLSDDERVTQYLEEEEEEEGTGPEVPSPSSRRRTAKRFSFEVHPLMAGRDEDDSVEDTLRGFDALPIIWPSRSPSEDEPSPSSSFSSPTFLGTSDFFPRQEVDRIQSDVSEWSISWIDLMPEASVMLG